MHGCLSSGANMAVCTLQFMAAGLPAREQVNPLSSTDEGRAHKGSPVAEGILAIGNRCLPGEGQSLFFGCVASGSWAMI